MTLREDLVVSAVGSLVAYYVLPCHLPSNYLYVSTFNTARHIVDLLSFPVLQDPSVANAPIDKRISYLQFKNRTQLEFATSLARARAQPAPSQISYVTPPVSLRKQPQQYGYIQYQIGHWEPPSQEYAIR